MRDSLEKGWSGLGYPDLLQHIAGFADTGPGRELLLNLIPQDTQAEVAVELNRTQEMRLLLKLCPGLGLSGVKGIDTILKKLSIKGISLALEDLEPLMGLLMGYNKVKGHIRQRAELLPALWVMVKEVEGLGELMAELGRVITPEGELKETASPTLMRIRRQKAEQRRLIMRGYERLLNEKGIRTEQEISIRAGRYVLPLKVQDRGKLKGIIHDFSRSRSTCFLEPLEMVPENNRLHELEKEEEEEIQRILETLTEKIRPLVDQLSQVSLKTAILDALLAKARYAEEYGCTSPILDTEGISLKKAKNPVLLMLFKKEGRQPVAVDIEIGNDSKMLVICGPNRGGKTVALKTLGLICLMAQAGIPIPAEEGSQLPVFEEVMAEIGDEQDLYEGESTFSAHIKGLRKIVSRASKGTLALVDEPGMGTSPEEGGAIAMAILERLLGSQCISLITTHYDSIKAWALKEPAVRLASVGFDLATSSPNFQLSYGTIGSSHAFEVAQKHGLQEDVIRRAMELLDPSKLKMEGIFGELEKRLEELEREREELRRSTMESRALMEKLLQREQDLETLYREHLENKKREAEELISEAKRQVALIIQKIKEEKGKAQVVTQKNLKDLSQRLNTFFGTPAPQSTEGKEYIRPGDSVIHRSFGQTGTVLDVMDQGKRVLVQFGGLKFELTTDQLECTHIQGREPAHSPRGGIRWEFKSPFVYELNVIGQRVPEALHMVEKALDRALVEGRDQLRIVHGHGTGQLRRAIREHLLSLSHVKRVRAEDPRLGGEAITVVEL